MSTMSTVERGNEVAVGALVVRNLEWVLEMNRVLVSSTTHSVQYPGYQECVPLYPLGSEHRLQVPSQPLGRMAKGMSFIHHYFHLHNHTKS